MEPNRIYHLYNHGNADDNLFRCDENFRYFLQKYGKYGHPVVDTYAYCLLPNHFHFLVKVKAASTLLDLTGFKNMSGLVIQEQVIQHFSNFFNAYTKAFNKMYDRRGKLFLTPFKRKAIKSTAQFLNTWKYIHQNPVRHQFTKDLFEWPFSSIHDYRLKKSRLLTLLDAKTNSVSDLVSLELSELITNWIEPLPFDY